MNPFFFGSSERPLFGVYTHGKGEVSNPSGTLLCYPIGAEYMRAHRAFRQLNALLNRSGVSVLRFDYSCTGDSSGAGEDATVELWREDIALAVEELRDNAMVDRVSIVGLRWGATLAAMACPEIDDVDHLVLWDPVVSGSAYLDERLGPRRLDEVVGLEGFPMPPGLVAGLDAIDLRRVLEDCRTKPVSLVVSGDTDEYRDLVRSVDGRVPQLARKIVPSQGDWAVADPFGDALIPQAIIQAIVNILQPR